MIVEPNVIVACFVPPPTVWLALADSGRSEDMFHFVSRLLRSNHMTHSHRLCCTHTQAVPCHSLPHPSPPLSHPSPSLPTLPHPSPPQAILGVLAVLVLLAGGDSSHPLVEITQQLLKNLCQVSCRAGGGGSASAVSGLHSSRHVAL